MLRFIPYSTCILPLCLPLPLQIVQETTDITLKKAHNLTCQSIITQCENCLQIINYVCYGKFNLPDQNKPNGLISLLTNDTKVKDGVWGGGKRQDWDCRHNSEWEWLTDRHNDLLFLVLVPQLFSLAWLSLSRLASRHSPENETRNVTWRHVCIQRYITPTSPIFNWQHFI